jgi:hypothetical protein
MRKLLVFFVFMMAICGYAYSSDIAYYIGNPNIDGWYTQAAVLTDVETMKAETSDLFQTVNEFDDDHLDDFAAWAVANTDDGDFDIIWLGGTMPSTLYQFPNVDPDGSVIEEWLDGGNMIINVADWFAYCSYEGGGRKPDNGPSGAANILDLASSIIYSADNTQMTVTETGAKYLPSLEDPCVSYRPVGLGSVVGDWEVAAVFASITGDDDATGADPVVIHNTETGAYVAFINQAAGGGPPGWLEDRGLVCAEFMNNWVAEVVGIVAVEPAGKLPDTWGNIKSR